MSRSLCPTCGQPETERRGAAKGRFVAPGVVLEKATEDDPAFSEQFERLRVLQRTHTAPGTDLRLHWEAFVKHPRLIEMLLESNRVAAEVKGRRDLVAKRRVNILRHLTGPDLGMPIDYPEVPTGIGRSEEKEYRVFRLRDELEWIIIAFYLPSREFPYGRPVREILTHGLARAILDWKASHLDLWLSTYPHLIGGWVSHRIPAEARKVLNDRAEARGRRIVKPREYVHEVRFSTIAFMRWYYSNMN